MLPSLFLKPARSSAPESAPQAWKEFVHYEYEQNRQGEWISGYPDRDNHLIDATRYALERVSGKYRSQA